MPSVIQFSILFQYHHYVIIICQMLNFESDNVYIFIPMQTLSDVELCVYPVLQVQ